MAYNQKNYLKQSASGVFHTDGIGVSPNDPSTAYRVWNNSLVNQDIDVTNGKVTLREFNQKAQVNNGPLATTDGFDLGRAYGAVLRANS